MRRLPLPLPLPLLLSLAAAAAFVPAGGGCSKPTAPGEVSAAPAAASSTAPGPIVQRFADGALPPPEFTDPRRREKLASGFPAVEKLFAEWFAKSHAPGMAVGVVVDGELAWSKGYGVRDVTTKAPVDADTQFRIASMSKSFTAMAILELRDQGSLSLDDAAAKYVPELARVAYPTHDSPLITLRHLLTHSAGFPEDNPSGDRLLAMSGDDFDKWIAGGLPFSHAPGTEFEYANLGFELLGRVVTRVSGMPYQDYVRTTILEKLGMPATTYDVTKTSRDHVATGYRFEDEKYAVEPSLGDGVGGAMGGLFTTVKDLARYAAFHLSAWPPRDDADTGPLRRSSLREMQQGVRRAGFTVSGATTDEPARAVAMAYAYGLFEIESCDFDRYVAHGGGLPGWGSWYAMLPDHGVAILGLTNLTYAAPSGPAKEAMAALLKTGGLVPRTVRPAPALLAAHDAANRMLAKWDDAEVAGIVADNFLLDRSAESWKAKLDKVRKDHGACRDDGAIDPENALRGEWKMACERGAIWMSITLAPTNPPRIQRLAMSDLLPPDPRLASAAERVAKLTSSSDDAAIAGGWVDAKADLIALKKEIADAKLVRGACTIDHAARGNGKTAGVFTMSCSRGPARVDIALDEASGKVKSFRFVRPEGALGKCLR